MVPKLTPVALNPTSFMEFGSVLDRNLTRQIAINQYTTTRFHKMATVNVSPPDAGVILSIFRGTYRGYPFEINMMERHCLLYTSPSPRDLSTSRMPSSA